MAMNVSFESARSFVETNLDGTSAEIDVAMNIVDDADIAMLVCITNEETLERAICRFLRNVRESTIAGEYKIMLRAAYINAAEKVLLCNTEGEEA